MLFPVSMTGLHCGNVMLFQPAVADVAFPGFNDRAPLRPAGELAGRNVQGALFPVSMTGLHCGADLGAQLDAKVTLFPVSMTGLHCGSVLTNKWYTPSPIFSRFQFNDRAPLRREYAHRRDRFQLVLFPVSMTGLHCGRSTVVDSVGGCLAAFPGFNDRALLRPVEYKVSDRSKPCRFSVSMTSSGNGVAHPDPASTR